MNYYICNITYPVLKFLLSFLLSFFLITPFYNLSCNMMLNITKFRILYVYFFNLKMLIKVIKRCSKKKTRTDKRKRHEELKNRVGYVIYEVFYHSINEVISKKKTELMKTHHKKIEGLKRTQSKKNNIRN